MNIGLFYHPKVKNRKMMNKQCRSIHDRVNENKKNICFSIHEKEKKNEKEARFQNSRKKHGK